MPNNNLEAKIVCPWFIRLNQHDNKSMVCCPVFDGQTNTKLKFDTADDKDDHIKNFCMSGLYKGCPIAIAAKENLEINGKL